MLAAADPDSQSGNAKNARHYGVPVVAETALLGLLGYRNPKQPQQHSSLVSVSYEVRAPRAVARTSATTPGDKSRPRMGSTACSARIQVAGLWALPLRAVVLARAAFLGVAGD